MSKRKRKNKGNKQQITPQVSPKEHPKIARNFFLIVFRAWKTFCVVVLILGFSVTVLNLSPKVSLSPSPPLNLSSLFSTPFTLFNDGYLPIWDVKYSTTVHKVEGRGELLNIGIIDKNYIIHHLNQGDAFTFIIPFNEISKGMDPIEFADIEIRIIFQPFPILWAKEKSFIDFRINNAI